MSFKQSFHASDRLVKPCSKHPLGEHEICIPINPGYVNNCTNEQVLVTVRTTIMMSQFMDMREELTLKSSVYINGVTKEMLVKCDKERHISVDIIDTFDGKVFNNPVYVLTVSESEFTFPSEFECIRVN